MEKLIIQLAPTGIMPTKKTNLSVPISPDEIIEQTYQAYELGVSSVHIHARDHEGKPTGKRAIYQEIISGIREKCPGMIICVSTTGRICSGERDNSLDCYPDMASLIDSLPPGSTFASAGIGRFQMQVVATSILMGGHVRIGLEDSLYSDYELRTPANNLDMIRKVIDIARALGREIATPRQARKILSLPCYEG